MPKKLLICKLDSMKIVRGEMRKKTQQVFFASLKVKWKVQPLCPPTAVSVPLGWHINNEIHSKHNPNIHSNLKHRRGYQVTRFLFQSEIESEPEVDCCPRCVPTDPSEVCISWFVWIVRSPYLWQEPPLNKSGIRAALNLRTSESPLDNTGHQNLPDSRLNPPSTRSQSPMQTGAFWGLPRCAFVCVIITVNRGASSEHRCALIKAERGNDRTALVWCMCC